MLTIQETSIKQAPLEHLPTQTKQRLAVIVQYKNQTLLLQNPRYNNITSFPNTGRLLVEEREYSLEEIQKKAEQLILETTGYHNLKYQDRLNIKLLRTFHKSDRDYNEQGIYDKSILIYKLNSLGQKEKIDTDHHILRVETTELKNIFKNTGENGSSHLIYQGYQAYLKTIGL